MKHLSAKLALLKKTASSAKPQQRKPSNLSDRTNDRICSTLQGQLEETPDGHLLVIRNRYPLTQRYGSAELEGSLGMPVEPLSRVYQGLDNFDMRESLYFDTETTGLAGGSGTYAFLVGIGFYQGEEFVTEQLMMRDHSDEPALLSYFAHRLGQKKSLVSFNGRTFDSQLLITRFAMHRRQGPFEEKGHLDLLHLSRRLWGMSTLPDCRLETLESKVLKAPRHQDVPGWMIPSLFFDFLRDKNPVPLKGVIEHNRRDLLAMVALCSYLRPLLTHETAPDDPHVALGLGRLWAAVEESERSDACFRAALTSNRLSDQAREKGLVYWARELKKRGAGEKAALLWRRTLTHYPGNLEATVELAKWLEHQQQDYRSALLLVEGGLRDRTLTTVRRRELEHRANRLRRRLG